MTLNMTTVALAVNPRANDLWKLAADVFEGAQTDLKCVEMRGTLLVELSNGEINSCSAVGTAADLTIAC